MASQIRSNRAFADPAPTVSLDDVNDGANSGRACDAVLQCDPERNHYLTFRLLVFEKAPVLCSQEVFLQLADAITVINCISAA